MMKKIIEIFKKWFGKKQVSTVENAMVETPEKHEKKSRKSSLLEDLEAYLFSEYDFRFNLLTEQAEYASKGEANFQQVDQRVLNTLCIDARSQGINCWDKDVWQQRKEGVRTPATRCELRAKELSAGDRSVCKKCN